jgi:hypothetical protein
MVSNHDPQHKRKHFETRLEIRSRHHVHSASTADLVAADDFAHPGNANRFAKPTAAQSGFESDRPTASTLEEMV